METVLDVLQQQRQLFDARRILANSRYQYMIDVLRLEEAAGSLQPSSLMTFSNQQPHQQPTTGGGKHQKK